MKKLMSVVVLTAMVLVTVGSAHSVGVFGGTPVEVVAANKKVKKPCVVCGFPYFWGPKVKCPNCGKINK